MSNTEPRLISATDIRREDVIQCDPGDYEIRVGDITFLDSKKLVIVFGQSIIGGERRELSQAAEVRLVHPSPKRISVDPLTESKRMPQRTARRYYWHLQGFIDDGETFDLGATVHIQTMEQGYATLMDWILKHNLDGDYVTGVEITWSKYGESIDGDPRLWAICVFTRGCALVLFRDRELAQ